ncbi:MAG: mechanosensitive ion channel family protein [Saprospirales bacterium]|nr:mechanosensitive ion channel family protein [Saprospirales bacterium]
MSTPFHAVKTHLYFLQPDSYQPELSARTIQGVKDLDEAQELALKLKQVYDGKGLYVVLQKIPDIVNYRDTISGKNQYVLFPNELPDVYLEKVGDNWYYSAYTIEHIRSLHRKVYPFGSDLLVNLIPKYGQNHFLGLALWQYAGFLVLVLITWIIQFFLSRLLRPVVDRLSRSRVYPATVPTRMVFSIARLASIWILMLTWQWVVPLLHLPIEWVEIIMTGIRIGATMLFLVLGVRILDVVILYVKKWAAGTSTQLDNQLVPILKRLLQLVLVFGAMIQILRLLNVNVAALIAGVSIGGLALALAAQDTVKNLIGSAMIFFDRPFQIGDWVIGDTFEGKVVEVGFRTTRIQLLDSSIIAVPNGNVANASVRNLGVRTHRLLDARLGIAYNTPPQKIQWFMEGLKKLITAHPMTAEDGNRVYFTDMADFSLVIMYRAIIETDDYGEELQVKEDLFLSALRLAALLGIEFAFPTSTIHVDTFPGQPSAEGTPGPASAEEMEAAVAALVAEFQQQAYRPLPHDEAL